MGAAMIDAAAMTLFPLWPCVILFAVILMCVVLLFMMGCASHRRDWCYDCHERCDGRVLCRCCRTEGEET